MKTAILMALYGALLVPRFGSGWHHCAEINAAASEGCCCRQAHPTTAVEDNSVSVGDGCRCVVDTPDAFDAAPNGVEASVPNPVAVVAFRSSISPRHQVDEVESLFARGPPPFSRRFLRFSVLRL
ncbi:MAG: hypothetical protein KC416_00775 [Myxococcales bacterium]|nr:hypothetical protein [Myxococcales bacterium]